MKQRIKTVPDISFTSEKHRQAIIDGDDHYRLWQRNVIDEFKSLSEEEIKLKLSSSAFPYAICCENFINDFNIATTFRNANAFNAKEVFYIGDKKFDRRGMQGVHNYMDITWLSTTDELLALREKYTFVGVDNIEGAQPLSKYNWKPNSLMIFGSESVGITPAMQAVCHEFVYIEQFGSVRSLNVATASGIIMNDFVSKFNEKPII
jgi:tRNA G18 (ribose-2'-O)-methylase SpoU